VLCVLGVRLCL